MINLRDHVIRLLVLPRSLFTPAEFGMQGSDRLRGHGNLIKMFADPVQAREIPLFAVFAGNTFLFRALAPRRIPHRHEISAPETEQE